MEGFPSSSGMLARPGPKEKASSARPPGLSPDTCLPCCWRGMGTGALDPSLEDASSPGPAQSKKKGFSGQWGSSQMVATGRKHDPSQAHALLRNPARLRHAALQVHAWQAAKLPQPGSSDTSTCAPHRCTNEHK